MDNVELLWLRTKREAVLSVDSVKLLYLQTMWNYSVYGQSLEFLCL